jgi:hypothetical protein
MSKKGKITLFLLLFLLLGVLGYMALSGPGKPADPRDAQAIAFNAVEMFTGREVNFPDDFRGRVVYFAYFANG